MSPELDTYCTSFCNHGHRLRDGKPVQHECYILPPKALCAEMAGDTEAALAILEAWKTRRIHRGTKA